MSLTRLVDLMLDGRLPLQAASFIASAPLTALAKPEGGIRPIAVGEILRRLVSKVAMSQIVNDGVSYLNPLQVGVASNGGIENAVFKLKDLVKRYGVDDSRCAISLTSKMLSTSVIALYFSSKYAYISRA